MDKEFVTRHQEYCDYMLEKRGDISRSIMWEAISHEFITSLNDGQPVLDTFRKNNYFVSFQKDQGIGVYEKLMHKIAKYIEVIANRITNKLYSPKCKSKDIFSRLGFYNITTKYNLYDHPLFGLENCIHNHNLYNQWINYCILYPYIKNIQNLSVLEIGAGSGILVSLLRHDLRSKTVIVDLPEMISFSSACIASMFPDAKILFPNEVGDSLDLSYDFIFLWPNQTDFLVDNHFDLGLNIASMAEMTSKEISQYFKIIQRVVCNDGLFFCSNRLVKNPKNMGVGDTETRRFFNFPWNKENVDLLIDINPYRFGISDGSYDHIFIDRLQKVVKCQ